MDDNTPIEEQPIQESAKTENKLNVINYFLGAILSFVVITALLYFFVIKPRVGKEIVMIENKRAFVDSTNYGQSDMVGSTLNDSSFVSEDSSGANVQGDYANNMDALSAEKKRELEESIRLLKFENERQKEELEEIWSDMAVLVEKIKSKEASRIDKAQDFEDQIAKLREELKETQAQLAQRDYAIRKLRANP